MAGLRSWLLAVALLGGLREALSCMPPPGARNWARGRPATQSSTFPQWGTVYSRAGSAVDGNRDGDWRHGSCSHTLAEEEPWWSLDLGASYAVSAVVVKNRQECCSGRLQGAQIHVGDCGAHHGKCNPMMMLIVWRGLLAVTLLAGPAAAQSCRPLPIGAGGRNLALGKPASQSSVHQHDIVGSAEKAVDGNCGGDWYNKSCIHTKNEMNPWWLVDLGESLRIYVVLVKNRVDCCGERLYEAEVHLGDSLEGHGRANPLCGIILNASPGSITTIYCNGHKGRYVSIHLPRKDYLNLCEVEAYGTK